jgi:hypothetical protein
VGGKYPDAQALYTATGGNLESVMLSNRSIQLADNPNFAGLGSPNPIVVNGVTYQSLGDAKTGGPRGDTKGRRDAYIVTGFHLTYIIPQKVICPKFR